MVCTRVPHESKAGRRVQRTWQMGATYAEVVALMDHLVCEGIERLVLESTSDYWRIWYYLAEAAGLEGWLVNAPDGKPLPGPPETGQPGRGVVCELDRAGRPRRSVLPPRARPRPP